MWVWILIRIEFNCPEETNEKRNRKECIKSNNNFNENEQTKNGMKEETDDTAN